MTKKTIMATVFLVIIISLTFFLMPASSIAASMSLKVEHDEPIASMTHQILLDMAKEVESKTGGQIKMSIHPACSLSGGNIKTMITNNQMGSVDVAYIATSIYSAMMDKRLGVFELPFLFASLDQLEAVGRKSELAKKLFKEQESKGLVVIDAWSRALRQFVNKVRAAREPADMVGLTFRVPENELWMDAVKALGANAISMPFSEVPVSIQTGAITGAERPTEFLVTEEWWTMAKYVTIANYTGDVLMVSFNKNKWDSIPVDIQNTLVEIIKKAGDRKFKEESAFQDKAVKTLRSKGMDVTVINDEQSQKFRDKMGPVWEKHSSKIGKDIVKEAKTIVEGL